MSFDLIVKNGSIADGTGSGILNADIAVRDQRIVSIEPGLNGHAARIIDASGLIVCPGFIDIHSHSDLRVIREPAWPEKILQGITTEVTGNCGFSLFPISREHRKDAKDFLAQIFDDLDDDELFDSAGSCLRRLGARGTAVNVAALAGYNMIRIGVNGFTPGLSPEKTEVCEKILERQIDEGCVGLSAGLLYPPARQSGIDELAVMASIVKKHDGLFPFHLRDEGDRLRESIDEVVRIGKLSGASVEISHLKVSGRNNWGSMKAALRSIEAAAAGGCDLGFDCYPYTFGSTTLTALLPDEIMHDDIASLAGNLEKPGFRKRIRELLASGTRLLTNVGPGNIVLSSCVNKENLDLIGKTLEEAALLRRADVVDLICGLIAAEKGKTHVFLHQMAEDDMKLCLAHPLGSLGSDGIPRSDGRHHPRVRSAFLRMLKKYVFEEKICPLPEAVRKMSGLPAWRLRLKDRGALKPGNFADICVFDPAGIEPDDEFGARREFRGMEFVVLNGRVVVENARFNGTLAGKILTR